MRRTAAAAAAAVLAAAGTAWGQAPIARLVRSELASPALTRDTTVRELRRFVDLRAPTLGPPPGREAWKATASDLRNRLLDEIVFRGVPRAWRTGKPHVVWGEVLRPADGYAIRKLRYEAVPGLWIPALLYEPDGLRRRVPAILNVNGHVGRPGKAIEYEQIRCINLARRGMLALHPEWLNCGELTGPEYTHNRLSYLDLCGRSGLSVFYLAMRRGLDVLADHLGADTRRLAMTGLSGGGWQTIWLSALDTRIAATAPNAGYIGVRERSHFPQDIGDLEQNPADHLRLADYPHLTALLVPRPALLLYNERDDCCFQTARARPAVFDPVVPYYQEFRAANRFRLHNNRVPGTHNYDQDNREQFYRFLNDTFLTQEQRQDAELSPAVGEILPYERLVVGLPPEAGGFGSVAEPLLTGLPRHRWPAEAVGEQAGASRARRWRQEAGERLRQVLRIPDGPPLAVRTVSATSERQINGRGIARTRILWLGEHWTIPVTDLTPTRPQGTLVLLNQAGRAGAAAAAAAAFDQGYRVLVPDLLLTGECTPSAGGRAQYAMLLGALGERLLGMQARQLQALLTWAAETGNGPLHLHGIGPSATAVAATAAVLTGDRVVSVRLENGLASWKQLIRGRAEYDATPELFCFGLLEQLDVRELLGLVPAAELHLIRTAGDAGETQREFGPLSEFRTRRGQQTRIE